MVKFFQSPFFKKITVVAGVVFFVATILIFIDPQPFVRLGYFGVFVFNVVGPGTLLVPSLAQHMNIFGLAFASALGMAVNDSVSWLVGRNGDVVIPRGDRVRKIEGTLQRYGPFGLFFWSLIPFPYDLIGLIAGYMEFKYIVFFLPTFLGKFFRIILIGSGVIAVLGR